MKKNLLFLFILILLVPTGYWGCSEKNLDLQPGQLTEAAYFKTEEDFHRALIGVYAKLTDFYWFNANSPIHGFWSLPGDDVTTLGADPYEIFATIQSADGRLGRYYSLSYQMINRANTVLEKIAEESKVYTTTNLKNYHKGEILFLRAYTFFNLWNFYGTAPVITERIRLDQPEKLQPKGSAGTELLDQAIKDLTEAANLLPASWPAADRGRITNNAANALLGKALLFKATVNKSNTDYSAALAALNKVKGQLVAKFEENFAASTENNAESLFEFQASQPGFDNVWLSNDFDNSVGSTSAYWGWFENHWSLFGAPPYIASKKLINSFDAGDPRQAFTLNPTTGAIRKYVASDNKSQSGVASTNNPRILRYADVILMRAEALVQSGGSLSEAIGLLNQVRTRARSQGTGPNPANYDAVTTDRNQVLEWVRKERLLELACEEGHRWFDLRRWHLGGQINLSSWDFSSARNDVGFNLKNLNFPIPQGELDLNPNMKQNTGY
jgi:hypothetical protein